MIMNHAYYDLRAANILLMKKRLQLPFTDTIFYLHFVKNNIDTDLAQKSIHGDMKKLDPEAEQNWVLYNKVPWEGYSKKAFNNKKEEFKAKALHVELKKWKG